VADYVLTRRFIDDVAVFEKSASTADLKNLDESLAAIVANPKLPGRVPSYYDPSLPSYLYRSGNLIFHFRVTPLAVEFLNLFWPKV
jgi:hypothetical protein